jgi:hypothetical protein
MVWRRPLHAALKAGWRGPLPRQGDGWAVSLPRQREPHLELTIRCTGAPHSSPPVAARQAAPLRVVAPSFCVERGRRPVG